MTIHERGAVTTGRGRLIWLAWAIGLIAYTVGVMHRTSFGVAGLAAADRFDASPAVLSGFVVLQLLVYAALQIPVGVLLDRFGARRLPHPHSRPAGAGRAGARLAGAGHPARPVDAHAARSSPAWCSPCSGGCPTSWPGRGFSSAGASALLTLFVLAGIVAGPLFGVFTAPHPLRRSWLVLTVLGLTAGTWTVVLAVPPPAPAWLLVVLVVVLALGGPGSMIGFDYARTFNPGHLQGTAVGIVNVGGFFASLLVSLARRRARRKLAAAGVVVPSLREVLARRHRRTGTG
ncbi:MAG TPA: hypothetical protein VNA11_04805 [Pseudonocardia sp.]|nr:hypothetical protein [Pseudonocardia sp.]